MFSVLKSIGGGDSVSKFQSSNLLGVLKITIGILYVIGSIDVAIKKAKTARLSNVATEELGKLSQPGQPLYGIEHTNGGLVTFGGGLPIKCSPDGQVIGAIGVAGDSIENDIKVAKVGVDAICKMIRGDKH